MSTQQTLVNPNSPLVLGFKRHLKYGDTFLCNFLSWDANMNRIVARNKRHHKIVHCLHTLHFLSIWTQLYCTLTKATNFLETAEAVGFTVIILGCVLMESEVHAKSDQISILNYICKF